MTDTLISTCWFLGTFYTRSRDRMWVVFSWKKKLQGLFEFRAHLKSMERSKCDFDTNSRSIYLRILIQGESYCRSPRRTYTPQSPWIETNPQCHQDLQSLHIRVVEEQFAWRHYYWRLTNEGVEYFWNWTPKTQFSLQDPSAVDAMKTVSTTEVDQELPRAGAAYLELPDGFGRGSRQ